MAPIFQCESASLKTRMPVERIGETSFIYSVSTSQIRSLQRGGRQKIFRRCCFVSLYVFMHYRHGVGAPVVGEIEGDYHYDHKRSVLEWQLPVIDESNKSGAMEFSIPGHPDDFFPINVSFGSTRSFCDIKVSLLLFTYNTFF